MSTTIEPPAAAQEGSRHAAQALSTISGEAKAARYLERLATLQTKPDELAELVSPLYGGELRGFCRSLEKALQRASVAVG